MSIEDLNRLKDELLTMKPKDVYRPTVPVEDLVKEAHKLYYWSSDDKVKLINVGLTEEVIESLLPLSRALRAAESIWISVKNDFADIHSQCKKELKKAHELYSQLLHAFRYAYRDNDKVQTKLKNISTGYSHADLIQNLSNLAQIGHAHPEELIAINFNIALLNTAIEMSDNLGNLLGQSEADDNYHEAMDLRNRAYTKLMDTMKAIRAAGQYVFWRSNERVKGYASEYHRKHSSSHNNQPVHPDENIGAA